MFTMLQMRDEFNILIFSIQNMFDILPKCYSMPSSEPRINLWLRNMICIFSLYHKEDSILCHVYRREIHVLRKIAAYQLIDHRSIRWNNYRLMNDLIICIPSIILLFFVAPGRAPLNKEKPFKCFPRQFLVLHCAKYGHQFAVTRSKKRPHAFKPEVYCCTILATLLKIFALLAFLHPFTIEAITFKESH